jgi:hypothetical protein
VVPEEVDEEFTRMLDDVELVDVRCYEISAKARDGFKLAEARGGRELPTELNVFVQQSKGHLGIRIRAELLSEEAEARADFAATYHTPEDTEYTESAVKRFVAQDAIFTIFPFLREAIAEATRRISVEPHMLATLRFKDLKGDLGGLEINRSLSDFDWDDSRRL